MNPIKRSIRSYVLRQGRTSPAQKNALATHWQRYCIEKGGMLDFTKLFGREAETTLEIGFGNGSSLLKMAKEQPQNNFIGIEVHTPGVGTLLQQIAQEDISNLKIFRHDAVEVLNDCIPNNALAKIQIFFPDPWHKKRHHKRRLIQTEFCNLLAQKLKNGGKLHLATDWQNYAEQMMTVLNQSESLKNAVGENQYVSEKIRPVTKFEQRGVKLGHSVWDILFVKHC